jgi:hypothetical protein
VWNEFGVGVLERDERIESWAPSYWAAGRGDGGLLEADDRPLFRALVSESSTFDSSISKGVLLSGVGPFDPNCIVCQYWGQGQSGRIQRT